MLLSTTELSFDLIVMLNKYLEITKKKESGANLIKHFNAQLTDHKGQAAKVIFIYIKIQN